MPPAALLASLLLQAAPVDADTRSWWATTTILSSDTMEGRDVGSAGHERAARLVAARLAKAGVQPKGDAGGWFQSVPMEDMTIARATIGVGGRPLRFLHDLYAAPGQVPAAIDAPLAYRGYCRPGEIGDVRGRIVICHGSRRTDMPSPADRIAALRKAGAEGLITIADPGFTVEPPRWPFAYSRAVRLRGSPVVPASLPQMTLRADALATVLAGSGRDAAALIAAGSAGRPLPAFDLTTRFTAQFAMTHRSLSASNVIGILPGTNPALADQAIVLTAHLDGYGRGTPVDGDGLYNGTLDDAAYVALLVRLAERRGGKGFRRPVLFAIVTGEEKGLLGTHWFLKHPTIPLSRMAANINLDQLRPIFPLELMTVHALDATTLGDDARAVAESMGIAVQADPEPERNLLRRSDHWPFLQAGVPATSFVFGYRPGSDSERIYRRWYVTGYHTPKDDPKQTIDWKAAADFNRFFYALVERVADQDAAPAWKPDGKARLGL
ncbi:M28 family peptidase [Sphingomonas floccifaciens]|uniref:M28 family peptidase n=1 Tax=Sphingomonas floccifaciens TaxID=1844115 RepID=A0ABW4NEU8_9SPHN